MPKIQAETVEEHRKLIRQRIKEAFEELLMEKSYSRITMGDVAKRSGIARNTLYNYVSDKAELFGHVAADHLSLSDTFERIASDETMSATDRLERMVEYLTTSFPPGFSRLAWPICAITTRKRNIPSFGAWCVLWWRLCAAPRQKI